MEGDEDIRGGTMEELPVGLAVGGDGSCSQRVVETAYAQGGEAVMLNTTQSVICVIMRGGDAGREVAIQQTAGAREMVAQQERRRCNNQPAQERRSARRETVA